MLGVFIYCWLLMVVGLIVHGVIMKKSQSPEGLTATSYTFSYDVHPCGSLMYLILSAGDHAYGSSSSSPFQIQKNLLDGKHKRELKQRRVRARRE